MNHLLLIAWLRWFSKGYMTCSIPVSKKLGLVCIHLHISALTSSSCQVFCFTVAMWSRNYRRRMPFLPSKCCQELSLRKGRTIAQAVSCRLPTAAARVQTRVGSCGILWWTKVALGQVFSENFGFPCHSTFHLLLHSHLHYHPRLAQ
jgi:hypothetical protein